MSVGNSIPLHRIKQYLTSKHVTVNENWILKCISEGCDDEQNVYKKWLNTDVRTIGLTSGDSSLPKDINEIKTNEQRKSLIKNILPHKYAVQLNFLRDMSRPVMESIATIDDGDESCDDDDDDDDMFKKKGKKPAKKSVNRGPRMLSLMLTDGVIEFKAIEDKPIECLNTDVLIGTKLLIIGPVDVYSGVVFLQPKNVNILGGSVDSMNSHDPTPKRLKTFINENLEPNVITLS